MKGGCGHPESVFFSYFLSFVSLNLCWEKRRLSDSDHHIDVAAFQAFKPGRKNTGSRDPV